MAKPSFQDSIVLFGDSLTQSMDAGSFAHRVGAAYSRKLDVPVRGYGGYNSAMATPLFDEIFARKGDSSSLVRMVTVWFGTNDSVLPGTPQHLSLSDFETNLRTILTNLTSPDSEYAVSETPVSIVLITPAPCLLSQMEETRRTSRSLERTREFRDAVLKIGEEWKDKELEQEHAGAGIETGHTDGESSREGTREKNRWKIETIDLWEAMVASAGGEGEELAPYLSDGLHFTPKGYEVLFDQFKSLVKDKFSGRGLDWTDQTDLPLRVPWWGDVDPSRPQSVVEGMKLPSFR